MGYLDFERLIHRWKVKKVPNGLSKADTSLKDALSRLSEGAPEYWSFKGKVSREMGHCLFQYPAMMVPQMQRELLRAAVQTKPSVKTVFDPFVGSGTTLTESMLKGLSFFGQDINPLAVLICRSKMGPFEIDDFLAALDCVDRSVSSNRSREVSVGFSNADKWFQEETMIGLSKIRNAIVQQEKVHVRRFLWVALAEVVRVSSNARISTVKLHIRDPKELSSRKVDVLKTFTKTAKANLADITAFANGLQRAGHLRNGEYTKSVEVVLGDSSKQILSDPDSCDLLMTSPPYGDNATTVTYGQHSYLPLQWIVHSDIDPTMDSQYLATTHEIDRRSLGGSRKVDKNKIAALRDKSIAFRDIFDALPKSPTDRRARVASFVLDLDSALQVILQTLKPNAYMVWTVGNRKVAGKQIPTDKILAQLLIDKNSIFVSELTRTIPSKRMAIRNKSSSTIKAETVLVLRNGDHRE